MKISSSLKNEVVNAPSATRGNAGAAPANTAAGGKSTVDLSATARSLASLQNGDNDVNLERVREISDAIAAGKLKVDPSRIADSLLASVRELLK
ncbi:flagellar biosynthesis anti-sigma factor FlgM [Eoetvoesiella caeni]|uniref:Negative regulator of flagellin synthesis n=1 Tax=Eoetvoesiella caeni TaxID=645616 RepID=A0A366HLI5_9BURK|nr:flagellar biosynthesis anti-sigma factor FlgM [Eoetvoesiella caeni]MCI2807281.1 flagellar biosynthesis anti-sigma factor FlgM [Eoetvoesiella caeni]NYT53324.1 flagellar biosynthesis anti-sigma factor FlgM [Eoetvoesiella caeni]RBP43306.1 FlgM family anti-sigma-28 factor [Eoetvoesiella caeni]